METLSAFSAAFFFVFFLQGQVLRITKNVRDEDYQSDSRSEFASIREALIAMRKNAERSERTANENLNEASPNEESPDTPSIDLRSIREANLLGALFQFENASEALRRRDFSAAINTAAIGFDVATREALFRYFGYDQIPTLRAFKTMATDSEFARLHDLVRLRNGIFHGFRSDQSSPDRGEAIEVISAFIKGVDILEEIATKAL